MRFLAERGGTAARVPAAWQFPAARPELVVPGSESDIRSHLGETPWPIRAQMNRGRRGGPPHVAHEQANQR